MRCLAVAGGRALRAATAPAQAGSQPGCARPLGFATVSIPLRSSNGNSKQDAEPDVDIFTRKLQERTEEELRQMTEAPEEQGPAGKEQEAKQGKVGIWVCSCVAAACQHGRALMQKWGEGGHVF